MGNRENDYALNKITKDIQRAGFNIKKTYRIFENPYYRFFILKSFSHIEYISGDLNPLMDCDIILDITDMNFEDNLPMLSFAFMS